MATTQYLGTGRRKKSVARVRLLPGSGNITINRRDIDDYFGLETLKMIVRAPLTLTGTLAKYDVRVNVYGGGTTGQAGAHPPRHRPRAARGRSRAARRAQEGGLSHPRSAHEGAQKIRPARGKACAAVQQALNGRFPAFNPRQSRCRGFLRACPPPSRAGTGAARRMCAKPAALLDKPPFGILYLS